MIEDDDRGRVADDGDLPIGRVVSLVDATRRMSTREDVSSARTDRWRQVLSTGALPTEDAARIDTLRALEALVAAAQSAQARISADFDRSQRAQQAEAGVAKRRQGRGIAAQVAGAQRVSPHRGERLLGLAVILERELPHTAQAFRQGRISQWRATIIARGTAVLSGEDRAAVDREIGAGADLESLGDRELAARVAAAAVRHDPASAVRRRRKAESDRRVTIRPAPDTMAQLSALLPVKDGVAVHARLRIATDRAKATGDPRSRDQIMADTFTDLILGRTTTTRSGAPSGPDRHQSWAEADLDRERPEPSRGDAPVRVELNLLMSSDQLFGSDDSPVLLEGFGPIDAELARELARGDQVWLRRCFTQPDTGQLIGLESRARRFPAGLQQLIRLRDRTCRTSWCDAPIRHIDHIKPRDGGGSTSLGNGQGLCEACNHAKQAPGWRQTTRGPARSPVVVTETPTGHQRVSRPPLPGWPKPAEIEIDLVWPAA